MFIGVLVSNLPRLDPWFYSKYYWIAALLPCVPIFTQLNTLLQCLLSQVVRDQTRQPPQVPYYIHIIGNAFDMLLNTERFLVNLQQTFGQVPFQLKLGSKRLFYVAHGQQVQALFSQSTDLLHTPALTASLRYSGMPEEDIKLFEDDKSGSSPTPAPGFEGVGPDRRIHYGRRMEFVTFLQGQHLEAMMNNFANRLSRLLETDTGITDDWAIVPDLYDFMCRKLFQANIETLCGEHILSVCPTFYEDFWAYNSSMHVIVQETPRWWAPQAYASRDKMHKNLKMWQKHVFGMFDWGGMDDNHVDYEPLFGSPFMRAMQRRYRASGFSETGMAANTLSFLMACNASEIPATIWALFDIILSQNTTSRVLAETQVAFGSGSGTPDAATLASSPFMRSICMETLRLRSAGSVARISAVEGLPFGRWILPKDALVVATSWLAGRDESFWNTGRRLPSNEMEHPLDTFWPERFLSYPDDPYSGPIRKNSVRHVDGRIGTRERTAEDDRRATVVTRGLSNHFFPFGGGVSMCPGRTFAEREMMVAVALILRMLEIEPLDGVQAGKTKSVMTNFPFRSLGFDQKVPVLIRRRRSSS